MTWIWLSLTLVFLVVVSFGFLTKGRYRAKMNIVGSSLLAGVSITIGVHKVWLTDRWLVPAIVVCIFALWAAGVKHRSKPIVQTIALVGLLAVMLLTGR